MNKHLCLSYYKRNLVFKYTKHQHHDDGLIIKYKIINPFFKGIYVTYSDLGTWKQIAGEELPSDLIQVIGNKIDRTKRLFSKDKKYISTSLSV